MADPEEMAADESESIVREGEHIAPAFRVRSFHCLYCGVLVIQTWKQLHVVNPQGGQYSTPIWRCECRNCRGLSYWNEDGERTIDPVSGGGPRPHMEMPQDVKEDYEEARQIVGRSPRGACALLRLAVQKLCDDLGQQGKSINDAVGALVSEGLPPEVGQALDALRVIGNNAVHPGELDLKDDVDTASGLFNLLNFVVQDRIAAPKERQVIFAKLPQKAVDAIKKRDGK